MRNIVHIAVYLMSDIIASYETIIKEIQLFFEDIKSSNSEVLQASTKSADEIGMGKSLWADLENGIKDPQLSTVWRIAEGLEIKPHVLIKLVENQLGKDFSFIED